MIKIGILTKLEKLKGLDSMKKIITFIGHIFKPNCVSCHRKATTDAEKLNLDYDTLEFIMANSGRVRMAVATGKELFSLPLCKICAEQGKTMAQVHAEKEKARLDELAKKEYYENLKIAVELKELEQRAKELGIETQDLTISNKGATSNELHQR